MYSRWESKCPAGTADIHNNVLNRLQQSSKHAVELSIVPMADGLGKFANIERALSQVNIYDYEWLAIADDDIAFDSHMLDRLISLSEMANLLISQPAHRLFFIRGLFRHPQKALVFCKRDALC